jgi:uncharacterized protein
LKLSLSNSGTRAPSRHLPDFARSGDSIRHSTFDIRHPPSAIRHFLPFILLLFVLAVSPAFAVPVPPSPSSWVNDYAGLLAASDRGALDAKLGAFDRAGGGQIVIAIFASLESESLEDFTIRLAEQWKLGKKGKDNGILLTLFMKERRIRIDVGYGLEGRIPDAAAGRIIREMGPYFRQNDYSGGFSYAVERLIALAGGTGMAEPEATSGRSGSFPWPVVWILIFIFFSFLRAGIPRHPATGFSVDRTGRRRNALPWWLPIVLGSGRRGGGGFGGGGGGGGGFGGGGGGGFGGGGSSGNW